MWYRDCDSGVTGEERGRRGGLQCCWKTAKAAPSLSHAEMDCAFPEGNIQKNLILCHSSSKVLRLGEGGKQTKQAAPYCSEGTMNKQQGQKMKAVFTRSNVRLKTDPVPTRPWVNTRSKLNISIIKTRINYPENKYIYIYCSLANNKTIRKMYKLEDSRRTLTATYIFLPKPQRFCRAICTTRSCHHHPERLCWALLSLRSSLWGVFCYGFQTPTGRSHSLKQPNNIQVKFAPGNKTSCRLA